MIYNDGKSCGFSIAQIIHKTVSINVSKISKMKKIFRFIIISILAFNLYGCKNIKPIIENNEFIYIHNNNSIELIFENGKNQLILDETNEIKIELKNIKCEKLSISGKGIRMLNMTDGNCVLEVYPKISEHTKTNEFELKVSFRDNDKKIEHLFKIPIANSK